MDTELPKAILLDLDDTIIANEVLKKECWDRVGKEFSTRLGGLNAEDLITAILRKSSWFWSDPDRHKEWRQKLDEARRIIVESVFNELGINSADLSIEIADRFSEIRNQAMYLFPGAVETIQKLKQGGIRLVLVTNGSSRTQRMKIERFDLGHLFEHILIEGEQGVGKPDERIYKIALDRTGTDPNETWMIGDNIIWDVLAPQRLGIKGIWIDNKNDVPKQIPQEKPFLSIGSLSEILNFIR